MDRQTLPPHLDHLDLARYMREALAEAERAGEAGELPIGALLVIDDVVVARGRQAARARRTQIVHAELQVLLAGGDALREGCQRAVLFSTVEPCPMCLGAAVMADVPHIVFAATDALAGAGGLIDADAYIGRHVRTYKSGVLEAECRTLVGRYDPSLLACMTTGVMPS